MTEYVDRELALESLCTACELVPIDEKELCPYKFTGCQEYDNLFSLPAADVRPVVRGRWEPSEKNPGWVVCSVCRDCYIETGWVTEKKWRFCPSCGAEMEGVDG